MITNKKIKIIILSLCLISINSDYCSSILSPKVPNDCTLFSYENNTCCFCKGNSNKCISSELKSDSPECDNIICEDDFFYNFTLESNEPTNNKNKCTFKYDNSKGSFAYSGNQTFDFTINGLYLECQYSSFIHISSLSMFIFLLYA